MLFRAGLLGMSILAWVGTAWIASHVSTDPVVLGRYSPGYFALVVTSFTAATALTAAQFGALHGRLYRARGNLTLVAVSVLGSLVLAEIAVRLTDPIGISYYEDSRRYQLDKVADGQLVFRHPPHLDEVYQGTRVLTNELGFRDRPVGPKAQGEYRILVLGDSVTFGWGVAAEDTFPRLVETSLAQALKRPVRTINTAVGGYNTSQELAMAERHAETLQADLLLLVYVSNDVEPLPASFDPWREVALAGKSPPEVARLLAWRSWTYRLARHVWEHRRARPEQTPNVRASGWQDSMDSVARLGTLARDRGLPLFVFFSRYRSTPTTDRLMADLTALAGRHQFILVDTVGWLAGLDRNSYMNSVVDVHPNSLGHRVMGERIASVLLESQVVRRGESASFRYRD